MSQLSVSQFLIVSHFDFEKHFKNSFAISSKYNRYIILYYYLVSHVSHVLGGVCMYMLFFCEKLRNWKKTSICLVFLTFKNICETLRINKHSSEKHFAFSEVTV